MNVLQPRVTHTRSRSLHGDKVSIKKNQLWGKLVFDLLRRDIVVCSCQHGRARNATRVSVESLVSHMLDGIETSDTDATKDGMGNRGSATLSHLSQTSPTERHEIVCLLAPSKITSWTIFEPDQVRHC